MDPQSKLHCTVSNLFTLAAVLLVMLGGSALTHEWTLDLPVDYERAEYMGIADLLNTGSPELLATEAGQNYV